MSDTDDGNKVAVIVKMDASGLWFMPPSDAYLALMADIREAESKATRMAAQSMLNTFGSSCLSQQSPEYRALVDEVRKWMPVAAGGMGIDPNAPPGTAPAPDIHHKPPTPDQVKAEYRRIEREAAVFRAIARPQAMRVGVFTFDR
jgi:hypothetical protein